MRRLASRLAAVMTVLMFSPVTAAATFYVDIVGATQGDINGNVSIPDDPLDGQIEGFELHHFVSRPSAPGSLAVHEAIIFTKNRVDQSTVPLLQAWDQSESLTVTFTFCVALPCDQVRYYINLTGAQVISIEPWTRPTGEQERIRLTYQTIELVYPDDNNETATLVP